MSAILDWLFVLGAVLIVGRSAMRVGWQRTRADSATYAMIGIGLLGLRGALRLDENAASSWALRVVALLAIVYGYLLARKRWSSQGAA